MKWGAQIFNGGRASLAPPLATALIKCQYFHSALATQLEFLHYRQLASWYICFVWSLHSSIQCSCRMSIHSCCFCAQDGEKLWFWMYLRQISMLFQAVFLVFLRAQWLLRHKDLARVFDYDLYRRMPACFVYLCYHPRSHFTKLLTRALFFDLVTVHIFSFYVWPFAFMLQVTWIKNIVRSKRSHDFVCSHFTRAHPLEL